MIEHDDLRRWAIPHTDKTSKSEHDNSSVGCNYMEDSLSVKASCEDSSLEDAV